LPHDPAAGRAECRAYRQFVLPLRAPREQQMDITGIRMISSDATAPNSK
jgi:hypothetical protein